MVNKENERLLVVRNELRRLTVLPGWTMSKQIATNVVTAATQEALDEDDPLKAEAKRVLAKAMQKGFRQYFETIETAKQFNDVAESEWFSELGFDFPDSEGN